MATYVEIDGHPTWVEDRGGSGETVLLLHGGLSNSDLLLESIGPGLVDEFRVVAFDRRGHGYTADTEAEFHYADMATEVQKVLEQVGGGPAHLVGWSDGGIVALLVALERPELVGRVVAISANFHHDGVIPGFKVDPQSTFARGISAAYCERSPNGPEHLDVVVGKTFAMWKSEPTLTTLDIGRIPSPTLVVAGDDDVIALSHTCSLYEALPRGQLAIVPRTSHALPLERPTVLAGLILDFLAAVDPPDTLLPVRRAAEGT
jgi:pimeloyl-ACP methyl ester carboxylesterase